jgi:hypothetical protein
MQKRHHYLEQIETLRQNFSDAYYRRSRELMFAEMQIQVANAILEMTEDLSEDPDYVIDESNPVIRNMAALQVNVRDTFDQLVETTTIGDLVTQLKSGVVTDGLKENYDRVIDHLQANALVDLQNGTRTLICVDAINSFVDNVVNNVVNGMGNSIKDMIEAAFDGHIASIEYQRIIADTEEESQLFDELKTLLDMDKTIISSAVINLSQDEIKRRPAEALNMIRELCPLATKEIIVVNTEGDVSPVGIYNFDTPLNLLCTAAVNGIGDVLDAIIDFGESIAAIITSFNISAVIDVLEGVWNIAKGVVTSTVEQFKDAFEALTGNTFVTLRENNTVPRLAPFCVEQGSVIIGALTQSGKAVMPTITNSYAVGNNPFHYRDDEHATFHLYKFYKEGTEFMYELNHSCIFYKVLTPVLSSDDFTPDDDPNAEWYEVGYKIVPKIGTNALLFQHPETGKIYMDGWFMSNNNPSSMVTIDPSFLTSDNLIPISSPFYRAVFGEYNSTEDFNDPAGMYEVFHKAIVNSIFELIGCVPRAQLEPSNGLVYSYEQAYLVNNSSNPDALKPSNYFTDTTMPDLISAKLMFDAAEQHETTKTVAGFTSVHTLPIRAKVKQSISSLSKTDFFKVDKLSKTWREIYAIIHMFSGVVLPPNFDAGINLGELPTKTDIGIELPSIFDNSIVNDVLVGQAADSIIRELMAGVSTDNFLDARVACLFMGNMARLLDILDCNTKLDSNIMLPNAPYVPGIRLLTNDEKIRLAIEETKPLLVALSAIGIGLMAPRLIPKVITLVRRVLPLSMSTVGWLGKWKLKRNAKISRKNSEQVINDIVNVDTKVIQTKTILENGIGDIVNKVTDVSNKIDKNESDRKKLWP